MTLITKQELAQSLNVSPRTLDRWHARRIGPPRVKVGNLIGYRPEAVTDWLVLNETKPVSRSK